MENGDNRKTFIRVVRLGSMTAAAQQQLVMSQPSVSKILLPIEQQMEVNLFEWYKGKMQPDRAVCLGGAEGDREHLEA